MTTNPIQQNGMELLKYGLTTAILMVALQVFAGGIRGTVKADDGAFLSYATIYVKQLGTGTTTNVNGYYELTISAGTYDIVYQYLGYETQEIRVTVGDRFTEINIVMKQQVIMLQQVTISSGNEDPAYTIMRKAIAKAKYHTQQIDSFSARVYIKGAGKLKDYPWLAKKTLEKEGIKKDRVFISESLSEFSYKRPATFSEKVISIRSDGKDNNTSPNAFIFGSFYQPVIAETVSPLSPAAFGYYKFEYQGTFKDRHYDISKIKVTPRARGDNVVEGTLFIVEDWWSIHSLDITTTKLGVRIDVKQVYAPVDEKAWLPVSQQFKVDGRFFGFEFEYTYLATVSDYRIILNPELVVETMEVIDDKINREQAKEIEKKYSQKNQQLQERIASGKEITRKELKTILKVYEKEERKAQQEPEVLYNTSFKVDSGAYKKDSAYWALLRPVPLTPEEVKGYKITDSLAIEEKKREEGDTIKRAKKNKKGFQPWDLFIGDYYKLSKHANLQIEIPQVGFNTVEGFNLIYRLNYGIIVQDTNRTRINIRPTFRYAFTRETASGTLRLQVRNPNYRFDLEGGRYIKQFNADEPILPVLNTLTTLLSGQNWMKIYERDFVSLFYRKRFSQKYSAETTWQWAKRRELLNHNNFNWLSRGKNEGFTPNAPVNLELPNTNFDEHYAFIGSIGFSARPWLKYRIRNGRKSEINNSSPSFSLHYEKGFTGFKSALNYDRIELGGRHEFGIGVRGRMHLALQAGSFLNADSLAFMDYKHFMGNRTALATTDPIGSFRLLDYYLHSTADNYFIANMHYQFRRFLVSSIYEVRMLGIRENIFVNYLATPTSKNYTEVGYSINGILRFFRLEAAVAFQNGKYKSYGLRFGIATNLAVRFSDN